MLVPLHAMDNGSVDIALTLCWVYGVSGGLTADGAAEYEAADRVVRKWKLLAGVPVKLEPGRWVIDVPDDLHETSKTRTLFGFGATMHDEPYHLAAGLSAPPSLLSSAPSGFSSEPKLRLFVPSSVPSCFTEHIKRDHPLLHVQVGFYSDAISVGITLPHGAVDGQGYGMVARALDAELHRREWEVPPLFEINPLDRPLKALSEDQEVAEQAKKVPRSLDGWRAFSVTGLARLLSNMAAEVYWWRAEQRWLFLRQAVVDHLVKKVKEEVKKQTGGKEYVSTGDVLEAWFLKAALADESSSLASVGVSSVLNLRALISSYASSSAPVDLSLYPHGVVAHYDLLTSPLPLSTLAAIPLSALALTFRRNLLRQRTLPYLQTCPLIVPSQTDTPPLIPQREWPSFLPSFISALFSRTGSTSRWFFTNQMSLGVADLALPDLSAIAEGEGGEAKGKDLPLLSYALTGRMPLLLDHSVAMQQVRGVGVTIGARIRRDRWEAVRREVERLEREVEGKEEIGQ